MRAYKLGCCFTIGFACVFGLAQPIGFAQEMDAEAIEVQTEMLTPMETEVFFVQAEPVEQGNVTSIEIVAADNPKVPLIGAINLTSEIGANDPATEENAKLKPIRIFCKVLDHQLSEVLGDDYASPSFLSEGCRGFWLPPNDVLITLNVSFPVRIEEKQTNSKVDEKETSDLWNLYEKQSSGGEIQFTNPTLKVYTTVVKDENNREKVDQLKKAITDVIAKYGLRLKEEFPFDRLSIVVNGGSGRNAFAIRRAPVEKRVVIGRTKEAQAMEMDNLKRILSLKEEQTALAAENLERLQQQADSGRVSISEVDQAREKLMERKIELEKMHQEMTILKQKQEDMERTLSEKMIGMQNEEVLRVEPGEKGVTMKKMAGKWTPGVEVHEALSLGMKIGTPNSTMILQIQGEQVTDSETIQNSIQITSY